MLVTPNIRVAAFPDAFHKHIDPDKTLQLSASQAALQVFAHYHTLAPALWQGFSIQSELRVTQRLTPALQSAAIIGGDEVSFAISPEPPKLDVGMDAASCDTPESRAWRAAGK